MTPRAKTVAVGVLFWFAFAPVAILGLLLLPVGILLYALGNDNIRERVFQVGRAADQFDNALLFGGLSQETISSHCGRWVLSGQPLPLRVRLVVMLTDCFETDHCINAIQLPFIGQPL